MLFFLKGVVIIAHIITIGSGKNKQYRINYELPKINGVRRRASKTFPVGTPKHVVEDYKLKLEIELRTGELNTHSNILLTDYIETVYFPTYTKFLSPTTVTNYWKLYDSKKDYCIKKYFAGKKLSSITRRDVQTYINVLSDHMSPKTVRAYQTWLHSVYDTAITEDVIKPNCNPADHNKLPPKVKPDIEAFTLEQLNQLLMLSENDPVAHITIGLGALAGLRRGEMLGLRWCDVDLTEGSAELKIVQTVVVVDGKRIVKTPKTKAGRRIIPIPKMLADILKKEQLRYMKNKLQYGAEFKDEGYVICKDNGEPYRPDGVSIHYERFMYDMRDNHNIPYKSLHKLRHTYATLLIDGGANVKVVQKCLGHEDVMMTLGTYAHAYDNRQRTDIDNLNVVLEQSQKHA